MSKPAWFWNERFWLPHNVTWADLADPAPGVEYPKAGHLFTALPLALGIFAVRIVFERFIASACARSLHLQPGIARRAQPNAVLEKVFTSITKNPDSRHLDGLSKQLDWEARKVQRWFRHRRNQDKPSTHTKFCESIDPGQGGAEEVSEAEQTNIISVVVKNTQQALRVKVQCLTISLFSYVNNMARVGSLVMCVHDASDFLLEVMWFSSSHGLLYIQYGECFMTPATSLLSDNQWKYFYAGFSHQSNICVSGKLVNQESYLNRPDCL
uniref:Ceramide synthase 5 n=1 Tax=Lates calcarifer TaxID=8187 RepID=A0A4W6CBX6_LATCA